MSNKTVYIHIGMPKTGTTFLQEEVFPSFKGIYYWRDTSCPEYNSYIRSIQFGNPSICSWQKHGDRIRQYLESVEEDRVLISDESLFGGVLGGMLLNFSNCQNIAHILKEVFPKAKIILTIRRQDAYLESLYRQTLKQGYSQTIDKFLNFKNMTFEAYKPFHIAGANIDVRSLDYLKYIDLYRDCFGKDNVLVLPQEMLKKQLEIFCRKIAAYVEAEIDRFPDQHSRVNTSYSYNACRVAILCNEFYKFPFRRGGIVSAMPFQKYFIDRKLNRIEKILFQMTKTLSYYSWLYFVSRHDSSTKKFISEEVAQELRAIYKEPNEMLSQDIGIDLSQFGYN